MCDELVRNRVHGDSTGCKPTNLLPHEPEAGKQVLASNRRSYSTPAREPFPNNGQEIGGRTLRERQINTPHAPRQAGLSVEAGGWWLYWATARDICSK